jgi:tripartite-type tricarboxylate transporter receptor subunit TctC
MAGHITALSNTLTSAGGQIRTGKLRALGVSSTTRVPDFPDVPTFAEMGYPELTAVIWFSLSGPAGMPQDVVQKLNVEVRRILKLPDVREKLRLEGIEPGDLDQAAFASFVASEGKRWAPVVKASGAQID